MFGVFRGSNWGVWVLFGVRVGVENLDEFLENSDSLQHWKVGLGVYRSLGKQTEVRVKRRDAETTESALRSSKDPKRRLTEELGG